MPVQELPSHIKWLIEHRGSALTAALAREGVRISAHEALKVLMEADPSVKKLAVQWLVDTYLRGGYRWEDVSAGHESKAYETLRLFGLNRQALDVPQRNLGSYTSLGSVYAAVRPFAEAEKPDDIEETPGIRAQRRMEREQALAESHVVHRSERMIVAVPLSEQASKWWGRGTQWCTAADKNNAFMQYHEQGPLIVLVFPEGLNSNSEARKLQLYVTASEIHFMDENDLPVLLSVVGDNWSLLGGIMAWAMKQNGYAIQHVPDEHRTPEMCLEAVRQNGRLLYSVPVEHRTPEMCLEAVRQDGHALRYVPDEHRTPEMCLEAVRQNGYAIQHVPDEHRTPEMCLEAVRQDGQVLYSVPVEHRTPELCLEAVKHNGNALEYVPGEHRTPEMCLEAVRQDGQVLYSVPVEHRTPELCLEAVRHNGNALEYVPGEHRTPEMCLEAVKHNGHALRYVPDEHRTPEMCLEAVRQNGRLLYSVPVEHRTPEMCLEAVRQDGHALRYVPDMYKKEVDDAMKALSILRYELHKEISDSSIHWNPEELLHELDNTISQYSGIQMSDESFSL